MTNLECTIEVAHAFWDYLGYPGECLLVAELRVEGLELLAIGDLTEVCASAFYERQWPRKRARPLPRTAIECAAAPKPAGAARLDLTFAMRSSARAEAVALITNELLRGLGHAVNLDDLRALL